MTTRYLSLMICILYISISAHVHAQFTCLDYDVFLEKKSTLDSNYNFAKDIFDPNWRSRKLGMRSYSQMSVDERKLITEHTRFSKLVDQQLHKSGVLFNKIDRVEFQLYFNNEGTIDFAACRFQDSELTRLQIQSVQDSLCAWLSRYKTNLSGKGPFRTYASWSIKDREEAGRIVSGISTTKKAERGVIRTLEELNTTRPDTVLSVNLERLDLREVPQTLQKFKNLKTLSLSDNELTTMPRFVFRKLKKLTSLNISGNRITDNSLRIRRNRHLIILNLQFNNIHSLSRQLSRNRKMESLWIGQNDLSTGLDPKALRRLKNIKDLNLYNANLFQIPSEIGKLKKLEVLDVYYNNLTDLPKEIGENHALLKLAVSYNQLKKLPSQISNLQKLNTLYAHNNLLSNLPDSFVELRSLEVLDISSNHFQVLPAFISFLTLNSLQELNLSFNKFNTLPSELFNINRLNSLNITKNPVSDQTKIQNLLPQIQKLEHRNVRVFY